MTNRAGQLSGRDDVRPAVIAVAVVDDHPLYRNAVVAAFEGVEDIRVELECGSVEELEVRLDSTPRPIDVVLLDLSLPGRTGDEAVPGLVNRGIAVLVLSASAIQEQLADVFTSGALGYLTKTARAEDIVLAARTVALGRSYVAPEVASLLGSAMRHRSAEIPDVTAREREVLALVARGQTDKQIAEQLTITLATVRSHLDRIRIKTSCRRRADLTLWAVQHGLISATDTP